LKIKGEKFELKIFSTIGIGSIIERKIQESISFKNFAENVKSEEIIM